MRSASTLRPTRRTADAGVVPRLLRWIGQWTGDQWAPVKAGRMLLLIAGLVTTLTVPFLAPLSDTWTSLLPVTGGMGVLLLATFLLPWDGLPRHATLLFPLSIWVALAVLGISEHGLTAPCTGLFALCFAYIGLTEPQGTSLFLLPVAVGGYIGAYGGWSTALVARLILAVLVWVLLAELLADLVAKHRTVTDKLVRAAHTDPLTGLANRRDMELRISGARPGDSLVFCDLDNFKAVNDTLGHSAGDRVLADFGLVLRTCLRDSDYAARYGGDEFVLLLPSTDALNVITLLGRLRARWTLLQPTVTFTSGSAMYVPSRTLEETVAAADRSLLAAKESGRNSDGVPDRADAAAAR